MNIIDRIEQKRPKTTLGFRKNDCHLLYNFVKDNKIKRIVETGVAYGFSSTYLLEALSDVDGDLISIDPCLMGRQNLLVPKEFYSRWIPVQNFSTECLDKILKIFKPDLFLHDSKHDYETMYFEYTVAHSNGIRYIASDDTYIGVKENHSPWMDFIQNFGYQEIVVGERFRIAERI